MTQENIAHHQNNISAAMRYNQYSSAWDVMAYVPFQRYVQLPKIYIYVRFNVINKIQIIINL